MPKDPTKNVDRYKIRGGQLNAFEFHQNQGAVSEHHHASGNWAGAPENRTDLPPDLAKAERVRHLLAEHGEAIPQTDNGQTEENMMKQNQTQQQPTGKAQAARQSANSQRSNGADAKNANANGKDFEPTHGRSPAVIREMMESRRKNDRVPDPEDIQAGRPNQSREKKEHGMTETRSLRQHTTQPATAGKTAKPTKGKEAALDRSRPGSASGARDKKSNQQSASRQGAKQAAADRGAKRTAQSTDAARAAARTQTTKSTGTQQARAGSPTNKSAATKSTTGRAATKKAAPSTNEGAGNGARGRAAQSGAPANGKAAGRATQNKPAGRATATRAKSTAGKGR